MENINHLDNKKNINLYSFEKLKNDVYDIIHFKFNDMIYMTLNVYKDYFKIDGWDKNYHFNKEDLQVRLTFFLDSLLEIIDVDHELHLYVSELYDLCETFESQDLEINIYSTMGNIYLYEMDDSLFLVIEHLLNTNNSQNYKFYLIKEYTQYYTEKYFEVRLDEYKFGDNRLMNYYAILDGYENKNDKKITFLKKFEEVLLKNI